MSKPTTNRFSPEERSRAVRMVFDHQAEHSSQWAAINSIAGKIGCTGETLRSWVRQAERDQGLRGGTTTEDSARSRRSNARNGSCAKPRDSAQGFGVFCPGGARPPVQAMIAFIDDHREAYGVEPICRVLPIAPSTYRAHAARRADPTRLPARARRDLVLTGDIGRVFDANFGVYGVRKVWRELGREGKEVARCTVARLMRQMGLKGVVRGREVRTTISNPATACPLDRVNRQFHAPRPNALWLSDFTYVATWQGFVVSVAPGPFFRGAGTYDGVA